MSAHVLRSIFGWLHARRNRLSRSSNGCIAVRRPIYTHKVGAHVGCESLEDRRLLSVAPSFGANFSDLRIEHDTFDASNILVRFKDDVASPDAFLRHHADIAFRSSQIARSFDLVDGLHKIRLGQGLSVASALASLNNDPNILYAEPDYRVSIAGVSTDPRFDEQWDMHNVGQSGGTFDSDVDAPEAWDATTGTNSTIVAVIDTGVDYLHEDLADNMWVNSLEIPGDGVDNDGNGYIDDVHGYDFFNDDGDPMDDHNHGTHVAGTVGAVGDNGLGIAGMNWNVQIMALKFLGSDGSGSTSDAIDAIRYAVDNGAQISNNSWGGDPASQAMFDVIRDARDAGHIFVAASGNGNFIGIGQDNDAQPFYPASYNLENIVAVAATDHNDQLAVFSNFGATSVDLAAPGVSILSTTRNDTYGFNSGTSMAAPHVAGALSLVRDFDPSLTYQQIIDQVLTSVDFLEALQGRTATSGRLNLASALIPDTIGPQVAGMQPSGLTLDPVDSLLIVFNESIDPATFTLADIDQLSGPNGDITPLSLQPVAATNNRQFALGFTQQTTPGDYQLTIAPDVFDRLGNVMDQDGDGVGGEIPDDQFDGQFTLADTVARFDFGTSTSPLASGYVAVTRNDRYSSAVGHGWDVGSVYEINRGAGDPLTRDFNYTNNAVFAVDLPNGEYDVIVTLGDTGVAHDQMGVILEGAQVDSVSTAAGQSAANTYRVSVSDGQLNLGLNDQGGSDPWVMINGLDVVFAGPDVTGPQITSIDSSGTVTGPIDRIVVNFDETIDEATFTVADVGVLDGPNGAIAPTAVNRLGNTQYEIVFAEQNTPGLYNLELGPDVADVGGNLMDQDDDGVGGENPDDVFAASFTLEQGPQYVARFDFGPSTSPVAEGYAPLTRNDRYSTSTGFGWASGSVYEITRSGGPLTRDFNYTRDAEFALDLPNAVYDVIVTLGDAGLAHDQMGVILEGVQVDSVTTAPGQFAANTYRVSVSDGQLNLGLVDQGGGDIWVMINGLDVIFAGPDLTGPRVAAVDAVGTVIGPIDRIVVDFDETIDEASFTTADVRRLDGPHGAIAPTAVNRLSSNQYEVTFPSQNAAGMYSLELGPSISDAAGNLMDQDADGVGGEDPDDVFAASFTLEQGPQYVARFDFGPSTSPVADGYDQITRNDRYDAAVGYGWETGSVFEISRAGEPLTRDFNYTRDAVFALDLANGEYDVVATLGDMAMAHDQMGVFLEGVQVDSVTTSAGQTATNTYRVDVADGRLSLGLRDLGGSDIWVMINALDVIRVEVGASAASASSAVEQLRLNWSELAGTPTTQFVFSRRLFYAKSVSDDEHV